MYGGFQSVKLTRYFPPIHMDRVDSVFDEGECGNSYDQEAPVTLICWQIVLSLEKTRKGYFRHFSYCRTQKHEWEDPYHRANQPDPDRKSLFFTTFLFWKPFQWLAIVSIAVLYNIIFVVGRAIFWEINKKATFLWYILDYLCDLIYFLDTIVHCHEGEHIHHIFCCLICVFSCVWQHS